MYKDHGECFEQLQFYCHWAWQMSVVLFVEGCAVSVVEACAWRVCCEIVECDKVVIYKIPCEICHVTGLTPTLIFSSPTCRQHCFHITKTILLMYCNFTWCIIILHGILKFSQHDITTSWLLRFAVTQILRSPTRHTQCSCRASMIQIAVARLPCWMAITCW